METNEPVTVYRTTDLYEAEIIRNALEAEGITCEIGGATQGGFVEIFDVRVLVRAADAERAQAIIAAQQESGASAAPPLDAEDAYTEPSDEMSPTRDDEV